MSNCRDGARQSEDHAAILKPSHLDYSGMQRIGRVVIERDEAGRVCIEVSDFEFDTLDTCRAHVVRAVAWARDVLAAAVENSRLVPGGNIVTVRGGDATDAGPRPAESDAVDMEWALQAFADSARRDYAAPYTVENVRIPAHDAPEHRPASAGDLDAPTA